MKLEPIIQSEVSQKNKYHILTHIYGIQKMVLMNLFAGEEYSDMENRLDTVGEGEDETN